MTSAAAAAAAEASRDSAVAGAAGGMRRGKPIAMPPCVCMLCPAQDPCAKVGERRTSAFATAKQLLDHIAIAHPCYCAQCEAQRTERESRKPTARMRAHAELLYRSQRHFFEERFDDATLISATQLRLVQERFLQKFRYNCERPEGTSDADQKPRQLIGCAPLLRCRLGLRRVPARLFFSAAI